MQHILLVEDEEHLATGIKFNLEAEGFRVTAVTDGPAAMQIVTSGQLPVDLVVLDLMLPGMSGYTVCEKLRANGADMPVLILSARTLSEDRTRGFEVGADQYLTKPFELTELLSRVKRLLQRHGAANGATNGATNGAGAATPSTPESAVRFGDVRIDFQTFELTHAGSTERLTSLEIRLLEYLVQNPNRVISRSELLEKVWHQPGYIKTRAPDQIVRRLRKLIEADPSQPQYILTVRDAGYRFVPEGSFEQ